MPIIIEFSRYIGTYSSAKFEYLTSTVRTLAIKFYDEQIPEGWEATVEKLKSIPKDKLHALGIKHYKNPTGDKYNESLQRYHPEKTENNIDDLNDYGEIKYYYDRHGVVMERVPPIPPAKKPPRLYIIISQLFIILNKIRGTQHS